MKIRDIVENRADYHYGLDPAQLSYKFKVGDIYGKKNLKVPYARLYKGGKAVKALGITVPKLHK